MAFPSKRNDADTRSMSRLQCVELDEKLMEKARGSITDLFQLVNAQLSPVKQTEPLWSKHWIGIQSRHVAAHSTFYPNLQHPSHAYCCFTSFTGGT